MATGYNDKTYVIIDSSDISSMKFDEDNLLNKDNSGFFGTITLRKSNDGSKAIVQYKGEKPACINESLTTYTHKEMLKIVGDTSGIWNTEEL
tara:strand:- start:1052 stop:1327 length:276 start_codon:yes stop_codon:yes gene_type:complete